jgi:hypothetical protein
MPNSYSNHLVLEHPDANKLLEFCSAYNNEQTCEHFVPTPSIILESIEKDNADGENGWCAWREENWGILQDFGWDSEDDYSDKAIIEDGKVQVSFCTAWSPPIGLYKKLHQSGFQVTAFYFEPGCCLYGSFKNNQDQCFQFSSVDEIPEEFKEKFDIKS